MLIRDPIDELRSTELYTYLKAGGDDFTGHIEKFLEQISPILATISQYFPYYTRHDAHHGYRVTKRIAQIIDRECLSRNAPKSLLDTEVFLLIAASYAHDLGMTVLPDEEDELCRKLEIPKTGDWMTNAELQQYLRDNHAERGGMFIGKNAEALGVPFNLVSPLHNMMRSHNLSINELESSLAGRYAIEEQEFNLKQLAVILCIADAIEFSETRVVDGVLDLLKLDPSSQALVSYRENMKHVCIGDSVAVGMDGVILFSGTFTDPVILSLAHNTLDNMEEWIRGYCDIDRRSPKQRLAINSGPFSRNLDLLGARFERLGVRLSKKNIINLISSTAVWNADAGNCIKELVQNAVEACRYRAHNTPASRSYKPKVSILFDRETRTVIVADNGCGMSEHTVLKHFLTVGNSRSKEPAYSLANYSSIARFGIGFWSIFTISERATVKTAPFENLYALTNDESRIPGIEFDVTIAELKDYTVFEDKDMACGTTITICLKPEVVIDDAFEQLRRHLLCSEIELTITLDGDSIKLPSSPPEITDDELFGTRKRLQSELNIKTFGWFGRSEDTELSVKFLYRMEDGHATFMRDEHSSLCLAHDSFHTAYRTAVCGFTVGIGWIRLCFDLLRVGFYVANHRNPLGFDFSIDRQQLLGNPNESKFIVAMTALIHEAYRTFLRNTNSYTAQHICELNEQSFMHGGSQYDSYTGNELAHAYENYPDLLCFKLYVVEDGKTLRDATVVYADLPQLMKMTGIVWLNQNNYYVPIQYSSQQACYYAPALLGLVYDYAKAKHRCNQNTPMYVVEPNRPASMLFDADQNSTVEFLVGAIACTVCIQKINLNNISLDVNQHDMLTEVKGRWSGWLYLRDFSEPDEKPYVFLGRSRVLIDRNSKLRDHLEGLKSQRRLIKLVETVKLLQEDDQGFSSAELVGLL